MLLSGTFLLVVKISVVIVFFNKYLCQLLGYFLMVNIADLNLIRFPTSSDDSTSLLDLQ